MAADVGAQNLESYRVYDLGPIYDAPLARVHFAINNNAEAVFHSDLIVGGLHDQRGHVWLPLSAYGLNSMTRYDLATLAGLSDDVLAVDINDDGVIGGAIGEWPSANKAARFTLGSGSAASTYIANGNIPVPSLARGVGPGTAPQLVGEYQTTNQCVGFGSLATEGFQWSSGNSIVALPALYANWSVAVYSTSGDWHVGTSSKCKNTVCGQTTDATEWDRTDPTNPQEMTGLNSSNLENQLYRININDDAVGASFLDHPDGPQRGCVSHAIRTNITGTILDDLGEPNVYGSGSQVVTGGLADDEQTVALGVNDGTNTLEVVGFSRLGYGIHWADDGAGGYLMTSFDITDLQDYATATGNHIVPACSIDSSADDYWVSFDELHDVNDCGWIIGWGVRTVDGNEEVRAFLLIPVDDPDRAAADFAGPNPDCHDCAQFSICAQCWIDCPDGVVDQFDEAAMLDHWGACGAPCPYNLDGMGRVDSADLEILYARWGVINNCIRGHIIPLDGGGESEIWNDPFANEDVAVVMANFDIETPADLSQFLDAADAGMIEALNVMIGALAEEGE